MRGEEWGVREGRGGGRESDVERRVWGWEYGKVFSKKGGVR